MIPVDTAAQNHEVKKPNEQFFKEMGLDTCYAHDFSTSSLLSELVALEKSSRFQQERTTDSATNEIARVGLISEMAIKKNMLIGILYRLENIFALRKGYSPGNNAQLSLADRQERATFVRDTSNQDIRRMLNENIDKLETILKNPPREFTVEDKKLAENAFKLATELIQHFD